MHDSILSVLSEKLLAGIPRESPFVFAWHTTIGVGGVAPYAFYPRCVAEFCALYDSFSSAGIPVCVLGRGSNVLVSDSGFPGVVLVTKGLSMLRAEGACLEAECGVTLARLLAFAVKNNCGGLQFLAGIPASVGGAVFMNAGAGGQYIGERVSSVCVYCGGKVKRILAAECDFSYKHTAFMEKGICILSASFPLNIADKQSILRDIKHAIQRRKCLPYGKSMGCVFKNPPGISAGRLIEQAGLKGACIGGAVVSPLHANFILNRADASAKDIHRLIALVKMRVAERFGVLLEEEIRYIGEF